MSVNFLTSGFDDGFPDAFIRELKKHLAPVNRLAFVASDFSVHERTKTYAERYLSWFAVHGISFARCTIIDDALSPKEALVAIRAANVVWLAGGPTRTQIADIRRCGLIPALRARDGVTIGMSAGSINMAKRVVLARDPDDDVPELSIYEGIGLVDLNIEPHINAASATHRADVEAAGKVSPIIGLPDDSFIVEQNGNKQIFGPHILFC